MEGKQPDKKSNLFASMTKMFTRNKSCAPPNGQATHDVDASNISGRNRTENMYRSLKKKFKQNRLGKSKQRVDLQAATQLQPFSPLIDCEGPPEKLPTPPPRRNIIDVTNDENLDDNENSPYYDKSGSSPTGSSKDSNKSLGKEHFDLAKYGWFWGPITKQETGHRLQTEPDGAFLVRDSSSARHIFTLSFRSYGRTFHSHIEYSRGVFSVGGEIAKSSVAELIEAAIDVSKDQVFVYSQSKDPDEPIYPVRLTKPVSRLTEVRSLKYLCRFVIRQYINVNNIQKLPLPSTVKVYLEQGHY